MAVGIEIYDKLAQFGHTPKALGIPDRVTHHARLKVAAVFVNISGTKQVLDFGCGFADLWPYLRDDIEYSGVDNRPQMLAEARRRCPGDPDAFLPAPPAGKAYDTVVCLGVLVTVKPDELVRFMNSMKALARRLIISWINRVKGAKAYTGVFNAHRHRDVVDGWRVVDTRDASGERTAVLEKVA